MFVVVDEAVIVAVRLRVDVGEVDIVIAGVAVFVAVFVAVVVVVLVTVFVTV